MVRTADRQTIYDWMILYFCVFVLPQEENGDYTYVERIRVPLSHGTLLLMSGATQDDWQVGSTNQTGPVERRGEHLCSLSGG